MWPLRTWSHQMYDISLGLVVKWWLLTEFNEFTSIKCMWIWFNHFLYLIKNYNSGRVFGSFTHSLREPHAVLVISAVILSYMFLCAIVFYSPSEHTYNPFLAIPIFRISSLESLVFLKEIATTLNIQTFFLSSKSENTRLITKEL